MTPSSPSLIILVLGLTSEIRSERITIKMPAVETNKSGEYVCYAHPLDWFDEKYIESSSIEVEGHHGLVHHVSIGVCGSPASETNLWHCGRTHQQGQNCVGAAINFVGWDDMIDRHDKFTPPKGLGIKVGRKTEYKYLLIEVHFQEINDKNESATSVSLELSDKKSELLYQSYLLLNSGYIPSGTENGYFTEIACQWNKPMVKAHRYYLHTHHNGILVEGYLVRNGTWTLLGSQLSNNQPKETYMIPGGSIEIRTGDILAARCLYINKSGNNIEFGLTSEMCNFNVEFGYLSIDQHHFRRPAACKANSPEFTFCAHAQTSGVC